MQGKYYELNDLEIGKRVSVRSLDKIVKVRILLDKKTFTPDEDELGFGNIVFIGNNSYLEKGISPNDVFIVYNTFDRTNTQYRHIPVRKVISYENKID